MIIKRKFLNYRSHTFSNNSSKFIIAFKKENSIIKFYLSKVESDNKNSFIIVILYDCQAKKTNRKDFCLNSGLNTYDFSKSNKKKELLNYLEIKHFNGSLYPVKFDQQAFLNKIQAKDSSPKKKLNDISSIDKLLNDGTLDHDESIVKNIPNEEKKKLMEYDNLFKEEKEKNNKYDELSRSLCFDEIDYSDIN